MTVSVLWLFLAVQKVGLQCVIVVLPGHTHLPFSHGPQLLTSGNCPDFNIGYTCESQEVVHELPGKL